MAWYEYTIFYTQNMMIYNHIPYTDEGRDDIGIPAAAERYDDDDDTYNRCIAYMFLLIWELVFTFSFFCFF